MKVTLIDPCQRPNSTFISFVAKAMRSSLKFGTIYCETIKLLESLFLTIVIVKFIQDVVLHTVSFYKTTNRSFEVCIPIKNTHDLVLNNILFSLQ